ILLEVMTDNKNRTVAEIRHILGKYGGNLGANGCVAWMFDSKGVITVELEAIDEDTLMEIAVEKGAEDIKSDSGAYEVIMPPSVLDDVRQALEDKGVPIASAEVTMLPKNTTKIEKESEASSLLKMLELLEENDDIQKVYSNFDIDEALLEKVAG
ncbi:MAG: YebC/PmpR family DNA-binding transcriptional regulator, partial [Candidatus Zixiibacteriota bacterium]